MPSGEFTKKGCASCADADPAVGYLTCPIPVCPVRKGRYVSKIHVDELPADLHTEAPQILLSSSSMLPLSGLSCKSSLGGLFPMTEAEVRRGAPKCLTQLMWHIGLLLSWQQQHAALVRQMQMCMAYRMKQLQDRVRTKASHLSAASWSWPQRHRLPAHYPCAHRSDDRHR